MDENRFWEIIEQSRADSQDEQEAKLRSILKKLDISEVFAFDQIFDAMRFKAYTWDLWGAAYIINGGCSDDGFEYFRCALIAAGKERFEAALLDAESLADWVDGGDFEFEAFWYVAPAVYREKSKTKELPQHDRVFPKNPIGEPWEEDDLQARFPRLSETFNS
jgi:hypothetical protein